MGVFTNAISRAAGNIVPAVSREAAGTRGLGFWLIDRLHRRAQMQPRLTLVERINLGPRQSLALIEADGQRLLVATSPEGTPVFYPLRPAGARRTSRPAKAEEAKSA